jgi:uncharacterized protein (TIGR02996 family)
MNELAGLLQTIHADPAEEANWLVLADWLEDNDDPRRGELLRLHRSLRARQPTANRRQSEERIMALLADGVKPCAPVRASSIGMELALIPPGSFRMGSPVREQRRMDEENLRGVTIRQAFYLGVTLATQEQYRAVTQTNPSHFKRNRARCRGQDTARFPVESVSWSAAQRFCDLLAKRDGVRQEGWRYRLPTEAEWEYACRAWFSPTWPFHYGAELTAKHANFNAQFPYPPGRRDPEGLFLERPCVVGSYAPNAFGLYDMHGNLDEWCWNWEEDMDPEDADDPTGPADGVEKVVRGGSWRGQGEDCRSAVRIGEDPETGARHVGFRVALVRAADDPGKEAAR